MYRVVKIRLDRIAKSQNISASDVFFMITRTMEGAPQNIKSLCLFIVLRLFLACLVSETEKI